MCVEGHIAGAFNLLYIDTIALGGAAGTSTPHLTYIPSKDPNTSFDGLNSVIIGYK
jgi:hypothetical protein